MKLGKADVDEMLRGMTARQFEEWKTYAALEPFDETRADRRTEYIVATLYNVFRSKDSSPIRVKDVAMHFGDSGDEAPGPPKTWEQMKGLAKGLASASREKQGGNRGKTHMHTPKAKRVIRRKGA